MLGHTNLYRARSARFQARYDACRLIGRISAALALLGGCSYLGTATDLDFDTEESLERWVLLRNVPTISQRSSNECGAAALASILLFHGIEVSSDEIMGACAGREGGIQAGRLRDYARHKGLRAYLFHGTIKDLQTELANCRPVLVGLVKSYMSGRTPHYEVVAGLDPEGTVVATVDPGHGWRKNSWEGFDGEWSGSRRLTLVVIPPRSP